MPTGNSQRGDRKNRKGVRHIPSARNESVRKRFRPSYQNAERERRINKIPMIRELIYNNRILSEQERTEFCKESDKYINEFSECIEGICLLAKEVPESEDSDYSKITNTIINIGIFTNYSFCDCVVLTKLFVRATSPYEKSLLRGKLKVQLNESFKKLYGFNVKGYKDSYCAQLGDIIKMFPRFRNEFNELLSDLEWSSKDSWWKDERDAEVHIDAAKLYELRHEEINESKVVMEAEQLIDLFRRFNHLIAEMYRVYLNHITAQFVKGNGIISCVTGGISHLQ